ncbi:hypothetical protein Avbf_18215 [Armadillidium vulgare]|nr:hypothetical protein Avbf_18215 [Armadillidium vulgare]
MTGFGSPGIPFLVAFYFDAYKLTNIFIMVPWIKKLVANDERGLSSLLKTNKYKTWNEFGYTALWTFFYLTAASACAAWGGYYAAWAAAAFFGFCAMIAYGVDAFFKFKGMRGGEIAQGERNIEVVGDNLQSPGAY